MEAKQKLIDSAIVEGIQTASKYFTSLAEAGVAEVIQNEARGDVILDVSIEGVRFQAFAANDPYVAIKGAGDWCQLGVASIHFTERWAGPSGVEKPKQWMVCKYSANEGRVDLSRLTEPGRRAFAIAFGIPIGTQLRSGFQGSYGFYASSAFDGVVAWARRHPRKFKAMAGVGSYVGDWKSLVSARLLGEI